MPHTFPRPDAPHLEAQRTPVEGACPECGAEALAEYRVLGEGGWWDVCKCGNCLHSLRRDPAPRFGSFTPMGA